jgi:hypothetical protein
MIASLGKKVKVFLPLNCYGLYDTKMIFKNGTTINKMKNDFSIF